MSLATILSELWKWVRVDIFGSDILAGLFIGVWLFIAISANRVSYPMAMGLTLPVVVSIIFLGHLSWFGWVFIIITGLMFGLIVYRVIGGGR